MSWPSLLNVSSPHTRRPMDTGAMMRQVFYATLPGIAVLCYFFGYGVLVNVVFAIITCLLSEALVMAMRGKPIAFYLKDGSALLTGVLLGLALPPTVPWWLILIGCSFSIIVAKQLYGGMGFNPFNPAMVGYVLLLISFPAHMTSWLPVVEQANDLSAHRIGGALQNFLGTGSIDGLTMATPLDSFKTYADDQEARAQLKTLQGAFAGQGWEWVNLAFLLGGLYLMARKIITWHIPFMVLAGLSLMALVMHVYADDVYASPLFHLFSGATMVGAFFIATDPVSAATSLKGRLIYGFLIGVLIYIIRAWGGYPDAIAFAVLLMNLAAPTIDYYSQPRTYGHKKARSGLTKSD